MFVSRCKYTTIMRTVQLYLPLCPQLHGLCLRLPRGACCGSGRGRISLHVRRAMRHEALRACRKGRLAVPQGPFGSAARAVLHGRTARFALRLQPFCNCLPFSSLRGPAPAVAYLYKRGRMCLGSCCVVCLVDVTKNKCFFVFIFVRLHYLCIAGAVPAALAAASVVPPACGGGGHGAMAAIGAGLGR